MSRQLSAVPARKKNQRKAFICHIVFSRLSLNIAFPCNLCLIALAVTLYNVCVKHCANVQCDSHIFLAIYISVIMQ